MKINEFNKPKQTNESLAGAMFGEVPMAALKGLFTGKGGKHQLAQDIFLKDFYQDALTSLDNGIKSGYVDPNKEYVPQSTTTAQENPPSSDAAEPTDAPAPAPAPKPAGPTGAEQTAAAAQQHRQDVGAAANRMAAGKAAQAKPAFQRTATDKLAMKAAGLSESKFARLNYIFESIVSEMEGEETISIADHMLEWFGLYMNGVNWESKKAAIIPQIKKIQDTYKTDKGKAAIQNLARFAYSISGKGGQIPKGAENAVQNVTGTPAPSPPGKTSNVNQIVTAIGNLKQRNPYEFRKLADQLKTIIK